MKKILLLAVPTILSLSLMAQNVGIGTNNPQQKLDVSGDINSSTGYRIGSAAPIGNYLRGNGSKFVSSAIQAGDLPDLSATYIKNQISSDQTAGFRINGNGIFNGGNVGIGTVSPNARLQISYSGAANTMQDELYLDNSRSYGTGAGNFGSALAFTTSENFLQSPSNRVLARVGARVNSEGTSGEGNMVFETRQGGVVTEKMRILYNGNVGIGTTIPNSPLTVRTSNNAANSRTSSLANAIGDVNFELATSRGATTNNSGDVTTQIGQAYNGGTITEGIEFIRGNTAIDGSMAFLTNNGTERMRINSAGTVSINSLGTGLVKATGGVLSLAGGGDLPGGSANYIQNQTGQQANANFNISGGGIFAASVPLTFTNLGVGTYNRTVVYNDATDGLYFDLARATDNISSAPINFHVDARGGGQNFFHIQGSNGNVGIGTANPYQKLDVMGNIITSNHGDDATVHGLANRGSTRIGMQSSSSNTDGFDGMELTVDQSPACGGTSNRGYIKFYTWGCNVANSREVAQIDENGYISANNWPAFYVYNNVGGDQSTTGVYDATVKLFDNGNNFDLSTDQFTAPVKGIYQMDWTAYSNYPSTGRTFLQVNGTNYMQTNGTGKAISVTLLLNKGDTVRLTGESSYPMTWYGAFGHNAFSGHLVMGLW